MIADLNEDDEERSRIMGQILGGIAAGVLIGYPLGGFLYDFIGESSPFILLVIVTGFIWGECIHLPQINPVTMTRRIKGEDSPMKS